MAQNKTKRDNRAALFKMFDPYEGFAELLQKKKRLVVEKKHVQRDDDYQLNWKIQAIKPGMMITVVYEDEDDYVMKEGIVAVIDLKYKKQIRVVDKIIPITKIIKIDF